MSLFFKPSCSLPHTPPRCDGAHPLGGCLYADSYRQIVPVHFSPPSIPFSQGAATAAAGGTLR